MDIVQAIAEVNSVVNSRPSIRTTRPRTAVHLPRRHTHVWPESHPNHPDQNDHIAAIGRGSRGYPLRHASIFGSASGDNSVVFFGLDRGVRRTSTCSVDVWWIIVAQDRLDERHTCGDAHGSDDATRQDAHERVERTWMRAWDARGHAQEDDGDARTRERAGARRWRQRRNGDVPVAEERWEARS